MKRESYDILIIGGGPIGMACGIEAKKVSLKHIIIEKGTLVNSIYNYPVNMTFFSTSERLEIGEVPFISHAPKPNRKEALEYFRRVASTRDLKMKLYEKVEEVDSLDQEFRIKTSKGEYHAKKIILATGFYDIPYLINVEGEDLPKVTHYFKEPHPYIGQKVVVVGGANSAVDAALETFRIGAEVTMVVRESKLRDSIKYWVRPDIENRIKEGSIKAYFDSELIELKEKEVIIKTPEGRLTLENDYIIAMTGYRPDFAFLEKTGVRINDDPLKTPTYNSETNETNVRGIYLAGAICGGLKTNKWIIENSRSHAELIVNDILSKI